MNNLYKKILLAIDGSEDSIRAAKRVRDIGNSSTKVVMFHAIEEHFYEKVPPITVPVIGGRTYTPPAVSESEIKFEKEQHAKRMLKKIKKDIFRASLVPIEIRVIEDEDPEDYILRIVEEENFDLVVLGCKGEHSKLKRVFMGTLATKVLNEASSDVLVVR